MLSSFIEKYMHIDIIIVKYFIYSASYQILFFNSLIACIIFNFIINPGGKGPSTMEQSNRIFVIVRRHVRWLGEHLEVPIRCL